MPIAMTSTKHSENAAPKLNKKQSWVGSMIRNAIASSALTAKAAVDAVRERIEGSAMPELLTRDAGHTPPATPDDKEAHPLRQRRTISAKTALSSIRNHLPRRSLDYAKRHSISDLLSRPSSSSPRRDGPEAFFATQPRKDLAKIAAFIPLPSSPIDVPGKVPSLVLEFSRTQLMSPETSPFVPEETVAGSTSLSPLQLPVPLARTTYPEESMIPDPSQPIAEARRSCMDVKVESVDPGIGLDSPLPGTNAPMELDNDSASAADVKEPENLHIKTFSVAYIPSIDGMTATVAVVDTTNLHAHHEDDAVPSQSLEGHEVPKDTSNEDNFSDQAPTKTRSFIVSPTRTTAPAMNINPNTFERIENSGPPSPDRCVRLPIRTKPSSQNTSLPPSPASALSKVDSRYGSTTSGSATSSPNRRFAARRRKYPSTARYRGSPHAKPDVAAVLRERTGDHFEYLERMSVTPELERRADLSKTRHTPASERTPSSVRHRKLTESPAVEDAEEPDQVSARGYHTVPSSSPYSSSPSRFNPAAYHFSNEDSPAAASSSSSDARQRRDAIHNRFSLIVDDDEIVSDEEDDDL